VVIRLAVVEDCWVEFTTPGGRYLSQSIVAGGTSQRWVFRRAVDMRLGNPGGIKLRVDGSNPVPPGTVEPITLRLHRHGEVSGRRQAGTLRISGGARPCRWRGGTR
jgi:uncharacterized protein DUF4115